MSILIRGMEMPTSCEECQTVLGCVDGSEGGTVWCRLAHGYIGDERTVCPLGHVLTPHGRLGDLDALAESVATPGIFPPVVSSEVLAFLRNAPTIIPASEEGET